MFNEKLRTYVCVYVIITKNNKDFASADIRMQETNQAKLIKDKRRETSYNKK